LAARHFLNLTSEFTGLRGFLRRSGGMISWASARNEERKNMGMSTDIVGYRPADEQWKKMKAAWDACNAAGIPPPTEVSEFFDDEYPDDTPGQEVALGMAKREWSDDYRQGFEIDIEALPHGVRYLRFYNSW
jgi:hypothetical protein